MLFQCVGLSLLILASTALTSHYLRIDCLFDRFAAKHITLGIKLSIELLVSFELSVLPRSKILHSLGTLVLLYNRHCMCDREFMCAFVINTTLIKIARRQIDAVFANFQY